MALRVRCKSAFSTLFYVICMIGFFAQLESITIYYLDYETTSEVRMEIPQHIHFPYVSICFKYEDVIKSQTVKHKIKLNTITISDIFESVPNVSLALKGCMLRAWDSYKFESYNTAALCNKYFDVDLFLVGSRICYRFKHKDFIQSWNYSYDKLAYAIGYSSIMFSLMISDHLAVNATYVKPIIHTSYPYLSYSFAPITDHVPGKYRLYYMNVTVSRLPSPYKTDCIPYPRRGHCLTQCITQEADRHFKKVPFDVIILKGTNKTHLNIQDTNNISQLAIINKITTHCYYGKCARMNCYDSYSITTLKQSAYSSAKMKIDINIPNQPSLLIDSKPKLLLTEYLIYVCSCVGIWFGVSIVNFEPFRFLSTLENRNRDKHIIDCITQLQRNDVEIDRKYNVLMRRRGFQDTLSSVSRRRCQKRATTINIDLEEAIGRKLELQPK